MTLLTPMTLSSQIMFYCLSNYKWARRRKVLKSTDCLFFSVQFEGHIFALSVPKEVQTCLLILMKNSQISNLNAIYTRST